MSNNSKIQIACDLCGRKCSPDNIKEASFSNEFGQTIWLRDPTLSGEYFICHECLKKLGWSEETEKPANTPNAAGSSEDNTSKNNITQDSGNAN